MTTKEPPPTETTNRVAVKKLDPHAKLWERQPREPEKAWACFVSYRDAGEDRSIRAAGDAHKVWRNQAQRWATGWQWRRRALEYDRHLDDVRVKTIRKKIVETAEKHSRLASSALVVLQQPVAAFLKKLSAKEVDFDTFSTRELLAAVRQSAGAMQSLVDVERVALGMPTATPGKAGGVAGNPSGTTVTEAVERMFASLDEEEGTKW